ncbi:MAG TPA: type IV pilus biogenesis/stability protein PilW [Methylophilaceae bacterium]|nr:type IV pilus biogenesis/stability protein PilW [Methylophilaceae bacterium]
MKKMVLLICLLLLGGCASQEKMQRGEESNTRQSARIHTELGAGYFAQRNIPIALEEFTEATQIDPTYAMAYTGLGLVYASLKEDAKAEANFKKALQLDPGSSESHNNYGTFLCSRDRIDESITQFLEAVKNPLYTTPESAYFNAGVCALKKKDVTNAEAYLRKALQIQPLMHSAAYQLASIQYGRGDYEQTRNYLQYALADNPAPEVLWLAIRTERKLGGKDAEASYALELRRRYPESNEAKELLSGK